MSVEESIQQIETLIEAWQLDEADLNQTDINAMQSLLKQNQKLEQVLDEIENILNGVGEMACYSKSMCLYEEDIEDIEEIIQKAKGNVKSEN